MPEIVTLTVPAAQVCNGDIINGAKNTRDVRNIKIGTKWAEYRDADGGLIAKMDRQTTVSVEREQRTEAERKADALRSRERRIKGWLDNAEQAFVDALAKFNESATAYPVSSHSAYENMLTAQADRAIAVQIKGYAEHQSLSLVDAFDRWATRQRETYTTATHMHRALSRSSSVVSNLIEDVQRERVFTLMNSWLLMDDDI